MNPSGSGAVSAAALKHTACVLMLVNHLCIGLSRAGVPFAGWLSALQTLLTRPSFVLFAFLTAEGAVHTKCRRAYCLRLLVSALASELFYDAALQGGIPYLRAQNVLFTLLLGVLAAGVYDRLRSRPPLCAAAEVGICAAALALRTDYAALGVALVLIFYVLRERRAAMLYAAATALFALSFLQRGAYALLDGQRIVLQDCLYGAAVQSFGVCAFPLLVRYDGARGRQLPHVFYYLFYPAHLALIWLICLPLRG